MQQQVQVKELSSEQTVEIVRALGTLCRSAKNIRNLASVISGITELKKKYWQQGIDGQIVDRCCLSAVSQRLDQSPGNELLAALRSVLHARLYGTNSSIKDEDLIATGGPCNQGSTFRAKL